IPASTVNRVVDELLTKGRITRGYLGVGLQPIALPAPHAAGLIVLSVETGGPADRAGVLLGDIFVALNGKPMKDTDDVQSVLEPGWIDRHECPRGPRFPPADLAVGRKRP